MPVYALTDVLSVNGSVSAASLTAGSTITSNDNGLWSRGRGNSGVYWETRPDATKWWAWYSYTPGRGSLYHYTGTGGSVIMDIESDGRISTALGQVAFDGHTHAYLPLTGGTLTGKLELLNSDGSAALTMKRPTDVTDRFQIWEAGINCGGGITAATDTQLRWSGGTFDVLLAGITRLSVTASALSAFAPIYSNGSNAALWTKVRTDQAKSWGLYAQVTDGPAYLYFWNGAVGSNLFSFAQDGRLTATTLTLTQPATAPYTPPMVVTSDLLVKNLNAELWNGNNSYMFSAQVKRPLAATGGGVVTFSATGELKWSQRFVITCAGKNQWASTDGYHDITMPPIGTVIAGSGIYTPSQTVTANGIPMIAANQTGLTMWVALYYRLTTSATTDNSRFYLLGFNDNSIIAPGDILVAIRNQETTGTPVRLCTGQWVKAGGSVSTGSTFWTDVNDGSASGLDADLLDGQHGAFYQDATNLNAGTVAAARLYRSNPLDVSGWVMSIGGLYLSGSNYVHDKATGYGFAFYHGDGSGVTAGTGGSFQIHMGQTASTGIGSAASPMTVYYFDRSGLFTAGSVQCAGTIPRMYWTETDATVDNKNWDMAIEGSVWNFRVVNDSRSLVQSWLSVSRTGVVVSEINVQAVSFKINSTEVANQSWVDGTYARKATSVGTQHSLTGGGDLSASRMLNLVNDTATPGGSQYYGTNSGGTRGWFALPAGGGAGTVTSVGLSGPAEYSYGAAISTNGNLSFAWLTQTAGKVLAAPAAATGVPSFRILVATDIPTIGQGQVTSLTTDLADKLSKSAGGVVNASFGVTGVSTLKATQSATPASNFACWNADPSTSGSALVWRSASQIRSDIGAGVGDGTVTSVGLSAPSFLTVGGTNPVISSGTIALSLTAQAQNVVFAGPLTGTAAPTFRQIVLADVVSNTFAPYAHSHGPMNNGGFLTGATAGLPMITGTSGVIGFGSWGTTSGTACEGDDSRLADARTPLSHSHGNILNGGNIGSTANLPIITAAGGLVTVGSFGTTTNTFCQGNDPRLSGAAFPTTPDGYYIYRVSSSGAVKSWSALPTANGNYVLVVAGGVASWQELVGTAARVVVGNA